MTIIPCWTCKHYLGDLSCLAFDVIPKEILEGKDNHNEKLKEQKEDIVYEKKD